MPARVAVAAPFTVGAAWADEERGGSEAGSGEERAGEQRVERSLRVEARFGDGNRVAGALLQLARGFIKSGVAARLSGLVLLLQVEHEGLHHLVAEARRVLVHE